MPSYQISPFGKQAQIDTDEQPFLALAIEDAPSIVRDHGLREAHALPLVSEGKAVAWRTTRRPTRLAWKYWPEIELRTPNSTPALIFDCDSEPENYLNVALGPRVCTPSWIAHAPSGHGHVVYCLDRPVLRGDQARLYPLRMLARVAEYYRAEYGADRGYVGVLTHNPVHPRYRDSTTWLRPQPWRLAELADVIPKGWRIPRHPTTAEGRNCALFRAAMHFFGQPGQWEASVDVDNVLAWVREAFEAWYGDTREGWHPDECTWIAKSVTRYCRENLRSGRTQRNFIRIQSGRGKKSGANRRERNAERDAAIVGRVEAGEKQEVVALEYGITQGRVSQILANQNR